MKRGLNAQQKTPGKWLVGFFPATRAILQVIINRVLKSRLQLADGSTLKCHDIAEPGHLPVENLGLIVKADGASIAFVWGRWKTALTPFRAIRTREPLPSETSPPKARKSDSMSVQLIEA